MNKTILPLLAAMVATVPAAAATYVADFNGTTLDPTLSFTGGAGYGLTSGGGVLTMSYTIAPSSSPILINPSVYTNFAVTGDYVARVTIDFSGQALDTGNGGGAPAFVAHDGPNTYNVLGADRAVGAQYVSGYQNIAGSGTTTGFATSSTNVTLQFQRVGQTLIESFADVGSSNFQTLSIVADSRYGGPSLFTLSSYYNGTTGASGVLKFSNLTITTPDAVPEAPVWAMMIIGFGLIGCGMRRCRTKTIHFHEPSACRLGQADRAEA